MTATTENAPDMVRFVLDGEIIELRNPDPTRTVLQFLREDLRRTGTKEGCAEGDCGACTVVIAEPGADGRLQARAVNSCIQFLPTLDGRELVTVESLRGKDGALHPVQQALVDCHGSQCGFCTPGFVMSLFALYKYTNSPDRVDIDDALAGNLCRCTGYRPIVDAVAEMYQRAPGDGGWLLQAAGSKTPGEDETERLARAQSIRRTVSLAINHGGRRFFAPRSSAELAELAGHYPDAVLLAGGTDVGLRVTKQHHTLETVIYTGRVAELHELNVTGTHMHIGAAVTLSEAMPFLIEHFPMLTELLRRFASPPIRNAGTLGGNIANGSPVGDSMPALLVMDAELRLRMTDGSRLLPLAQFYLDYRHNALKTGEFLEQVVIPLPDVHDHLQTYKVSKRFDQDISAVCGAFRVRLDVQHRIEDVRVAYGGLAATPRRAAGCESVLAGREFTEVTVAEAMAALDSDFVPIADMRASDTYRQRICKNLLLRFYRETAARIDGKALTGIYDYGRRKQA